MAPQQKVCIVGGGASGVALMWCLAQAAKAERPVTSRGAFENSR